MICRGVTAATSISSDAPLNRDAGAPPALNAAEIAQLIAFLRTLDDQD